MLKLRQVAQLYHSPLSLCSVSLHCGCGRCVYVCSPPSAHSATELFCCTTTNTFVLINRTEISEISRQADRRSQICINNMLLQATIIRNYFVKTQTSVASFSPPDLSIIFSNGMYLEVSPL